jgi:hypothetical protein
MNEKLRKAHLQRQERASQFKAAHHASPPEDADEALARALQEEELRAAAAEQAPRGGSGSSEERRKGERVKHPVFKADGLGFWLLHTHGIQDKHNSPEFVVRVRDVVVGDIKWAVISNYLYDMEWLIEEMPQVC